MDLLYGRGLSSRYRGSPLHGRVGKAVRSPCWPVMAAARRIFVCSGMASWLHE